MQLGAMLFAEADELLIEALLMELAAAAHERVEEATGGAVGEKAAVEGVHEVGEDLIELGLVGEPDCAVVAVPEGGILGGRGRRKDVGAAKHNQPPKGGLQLAVTVLGSSASPPSRRMRARRMGHPRFRE
jgi:hypothetical protein